MALKIKGMGYLLLLHVNPAGRVRMARLMKNDIAAVALAAGVLAALFQLLDWFLNKKQKERVSEGLLNVWVWLEEQSTGRFLPAVWTTRMQLALFAIYAALVVAVTLGGAAYNLISQRFGVFAAKRTDVLYGIVSLVFFFLFVAAFFLLHQPLIRKIVTRETTISYLKFMLSRALLYSISLPVGLLSLPLMVAFIRSPVPWAGFAINLLVWPFLFECLILWNVLTLSLLWMAVTWVLSNLIRVTAFLLDRALSQEKGVLGGAAILCLIIAAAIKLFK